MSTQLAALESRPHRRSADPIESAVRRLRRVLPRREDCEVLIDFLEDDLREGLGALADVEAHFTDVLDALGTDAPSPIGLIEAADDMAVLRRLEYLVVVVAQLRRRLSQAAGKLRQR
jgi:hypothetical protein